MLKGQVSFTEIRENTGIQSLAAKRKMDFIRFKYYVNDFDKDLSVSDFKGFNKYHNTRQHGDLFVPSTRTNALLFLLAKKERRET